MSPQGNVFDLADIGYFLFWVIAVIGAVIALATGTAAVYSVFSGRHKKKKKGKKRTRHEQRRSRPTFESLLTLGEYIARNPGCRTLDGIHCVHCRSGDLYSVEQGTKLDGRRLFICRGCGKSLYRS